MLTLAAFKVEVPSDKDCGLIAPPVILELLKFNVFIEAGKQLMYWFPERYCIPLMVKFTLV